MQRNREGALRSRLSVKVFLITFVMQLLAGALICTVLYLRTPLTYLSTSEENYKKVLSLVDNLSNVTEDEGGKIIDDFIRQTGIDIAIYDYQKSTLTETAYADLGSKLSLKSDEAVEKARKSLNDQDEMGKVSFWFYNEKSAWRNTRYELRYFFNNTKQNVMRRSIRGSILPMIALITVISLLCSYIYTVLFAKPVKKLSDVSLSMAEMDFSKKCASKREDEIGGLARDLDAMAASLEEKIQTLNRKNAELSEEVRRREELESQKDMFFSAASHELKTPVTVLEGQLRGMIDGVEPYADHDEYLPRALGTVKRMESLINEILTASRMQSGTEISVAKADMAQILEEKMEEYEELFDVRGIGFELNIEPDIFFMGNKELTAMALGSFFSNAVFYSKEGTKVEVVGEHAATEDSASSGKGWIRVTIRNTDAHIDEENLPHLFEPFYRTDASRSRRSGGSGLGLYLAKLIVEKQGGQCKLENDGEDVLATIELPLI